jgi:hypothetical protein
MGLLPRKQRSGYEFELWGEKLIANRETRTGSDTLCAICKKPIREGEDYLYAGLLIHVHIECSNYKKPE